MGEWFVLGRLLWMQYPFREWPGGNYIFSEYWYSGIIDTITITITDKVIHVSSCCPQGRHLYFILYSIYYKIYYKRDPEKCCRFAIASYPPSDTQE